MSSLITQVKSKLFIDASQKSLHALDGAYASLLHGRGLDFEDLRDYDHGDQVRDIDWRATARTSNLLVRRYRSTRRHTVLFLVDTGKDMTALAADEQPKRELAILVAGALGILTLRHGDDFSLISGDASRVRRQAPSSTEGGLERMLRAIRDEIDASTVANDREAILRFVARTIPRRLIVVIITDQAPVTDETEKQLRRLRAQHDVLWVTLGDAKPVLEHAASRSRADVQSHWRIPDFVHGDATIVSELAAQEEAQAARLAETLKQLEITQTTITSRSDAIAGLLRMLNRRKNARF
jgi:uncharacterized protein (DUF58 family)